MNLRSFITGCALQLIITVSVGQSITTFCNPMNLDYAYVRKDIARQAPPHRSAADPALVNHKGVYYLFATNQFGYWWSDDLIKWNYIHNPLPPNESNDDMCAPGAWSMGDTLLLINSTWRQVPLYYSTNPKKGFSKKLADPLPQLGWDPQFFVDDDRRMYFYHGSGNDPRYNYLKGMELDPEKGYAYRDSIRSLFFIYPDKHGWERFGENHTDTTINPYIEGAWMTKHNGKYYLQYGAPGTEFNVYGDGVYVADSALGPFTYQSHNPVSYKPGGYARGAGHGSTMKDKFGNYWHVGTMHISVKNTFERRLGIFPAGFDEDGIFYCNTAFGDYPQEMKKGVRDHRQNFFTGWSLLSYAKTATASSTASLHKPELAFDEDIRTYWAAESGKPGEELKVDLGAIKTVFALQVNYADHKATLYNKQLNIFHRYRIQHSTDGKQWQTLVDKSQNKQDVPHDYVQLPKPVKTRFIRIVNTHVPTGNFAIGDLRIFGKAEGPLPATVQGLRATRETDARNARIEWEKSEGAYAYNLYYGIAQTKLYSCIMVIGKTHLDFRGLNRDQDDYYFAVEPISETGVGTRSQSIKLSSR